MNNTETVKAAEPGTLLECIHDELQPGTIRILKHQKVRKLQNMDSGNIAVETLHSARLAIVDPANFSVAKIENTQPKEGRTWKLTQ